jgi:hypothetical protein
MFYLDGVDDDLHFFVKGRALGQVAESSLHVEDGRGSFLGNIIGVQSAGQGGNN